MCLSPVRIKYHDNYKKYRGILIHAYNSQQVLPCGKCYECKENKIEEWQIRWTEQLKTSVVDSSYLLTLTYSDIHLPKRITPDGEEISTLNYADVQKFIKRLRKRQDKICKTLNIENPKITYHGCGEYGKRFTKRPHYHILITNLLVPSDEIENIWKHGKVHIGDNVTPNSIKYVLKYTLKNALDNRQKIKIYQKKISHIIAEPFQEEKITHPIYKKLNIPFYYPISPLLKIEQEKIKIDEIYQPGELNEYRTAEKSFCSKGIGKNFITPEIIELYRQNPALNYLHYDAVKEEYKQKPLPRYYKEIIFNPKLRDETGKLVRDENNRYIPQFKPGSNGYEQTPRFKKQALTLIRQNERIKAELFKMLLLGYENYIEAQTINRRNKASKYRKNLYQRQLLQDDKNYKNGLAELI
jgi:hypothetical protein